MKIRNFAAAIIVATTVTTMTTPAMAYEQGDWLVRGRIININTNSNSSDLVLGSGTNTTSLGEGATVSDDAVPELDITYMLSSNWGVELILGYSQHVVSATEKLGEALTSGSKNVIVTKILPPTLTLQYHFLNNSNVRPYIGAGINYTHFYNANIPISSGVAKKDDDKKEVISSVELKDSWGLAAQAGVDIALNEDWFMNLDVKYIDMHTEAKFTDIHQDASAKIDTDIDPFVFGIGIGRKF
ncbi:MAG: OmpW family protein [Piscirickettsiaceae bacterium]|nr:OmpW family protein [Piscirickettsiaceae bacterium]